MIKLQIILLVLCLVETINERYVIAMKGDVPNIKRLDQLEHIWSAAFYCMMVGGIWWIDADITHWPIVPLALLFRYLFLTCLLNKLRMPAKSFFYLSDKGIDGLIRRVLGKWAGQISVGIALILILLINLLL